MARILKTRVLAGALTILALFAASGFSAAYAAETDGANGAKALVVDYVDVGNIWTWLDPINEVPFTAEVNPDEAGLIDMIEIENEIWENTDDHTVISKKAPGTPELGKEYEYTLIIHAKDGYEFDPSAGFRFVYGGSEYDNARIEIDEKGKKTAWIYGFIPNQTADAVSISGATVTGIVAKTYTGKAQTQSPTVEMEVNGTPVALEYGTDFSLSYKNNTNAGTNTASVTITGKGMFAGSITKKFTIKKAANPFTATGKTAKVKYSKVKKKARTLKVGSVLTMKNKKGTVTYVKKSGNKKIIINKKTGKVIVKKGLKKGTYKVKVKVKAAGNANYMASGVKIATITVKVI